MKISKIILVILSVFSFILSSAQCPTASLTFSTQAQIDNFATTYPGCSVIPSGIDITITGNNITNLDGLSTITQINGALEIRNNPNLTSISGLSNLTSLGSDFIIRSNSSLTTLNGLGSLTTIQGEFTIRTNASLTSIAALSSLTTTNLDVIIRDNDALISLNGLNNITSVGGILEIVQNALLTDISALSNLAIVTGEDEGALVIEDNLALNNLQGLGNANTQILGDLIIQNNPLLSQCATSSVCNYLNIPPANAIITIGLNTVGCNSQTEVENQCVLGIANNYEHSFKIYPNPVKDILIVSHTEMISNISIFNLMGQKVLDKNVEDTTVKVDLSGLPTGTYLVKSISNNQTSTSKIVKQ